MTISNGGNGSDEASVLAEHPPPPPARGRKWFQIKRMKLSSTNSGSGGSKSMAASGVNISVGQFVNATFASFEQSGFAFPLEEDATNNTNSSPAASSTNNHNHTSKKRDSTLSSTSKQKEVDANDNPRKDKDEDEDNDFIDDETLDAIAAQALSSFLLTVFTISFVLVKRTTFGFSTILRSLILGHAVRLMLSHFVPKQYRDVIYGRLSSMLGTVVYWVFGDEDDEEMAQQEDADDCDLPTMRPSARTLRRHPHRHPGYARVAGGTCESVFSLPFLFTTLVLSTSEDGGSGGASNASLSSSSRYAEKVDPTFPPPALVTLAALTIFAFVVHPDGPTWMLLRWFNDCMRSTVKFSKGFVEGVRDGSIPLTYGTGGAVMTLILVAFMIYRKRRRQHLSPSPTPERSRQKGKRGKKHRNHRGNGNNSHHGGHNHGTGKHGRLKRGTQGNHQSKRVALEHDQDQKPNHEQSSSFDRSFSSTTERSSNSNADDCLATSVPVVSSHLGSSNSSSDRGRALTEGTIDSRGSTCSIASGSKSSNSNPPQCQGVESDTLLRIATQVSAPQTEINLSNGSNISNKADSSTGILPGRTAERSSSNGSNKDKKSANIVGNIGSGTKKKKRRGKASKRSSNVTSPNPASSVLEVASSSMNDIKITQRNKAATPTTATSPISTHSLQSVPSSQSSYSSCISSNSVTSYRKTDAIAQHHQSSLSLPLPGITPPVSSSSSWGCGPTNTLAALNSNHRQNYPLVESFGITAPSPPSNISLLLNNGSCMLNEKKDDLELPAALSNLPPSNNFDSWCSNNHSNDLVASGSCVAAPFSSPLLPAAATTDQESSLFSSSPSYFLLRSQNQLQMPQQAHTVVGPVGSNRPSNWNNQQHDLASVVRGDGGISYLKDHQMHQSQLQQQYEPKRSWDQPVMRPPPGLEGRVVVNNNNLNCAGTTGAVIGSGNSENVVGAVGKTIGFERQQQQHSLSSSQSNINNSVPSFGDELIFQVEHQPTLGERQSVCTGPPLNPPFHSLGVDGAAISSIPSLDRMNHYNKHIASNINCNYTNNHTAPLLDSQSRIEADLLALGDQMVDSILDF